MTRSRDIGTAGETAVVRYLATNGFPYAERRRLRGSRDGGDIISHPGLVIEVKAGNAAKTMSLLQLNLWMHETEAERLNMNADIGLLVVQRNGYAGTRAGHWRAFMTMGHILDLTRGVRVAQPEIESTYWETELRHAVRLLRECGYGDPIVPPPPLLPAA